MRLFLGRRAAAVTCNPAGNVGESRRGKEQVEMQSGGEGERCIETASRGGDRTQGRRWARYGALRQCGIGASASVWLAGWGHVASLA